LARGHVGSVGRRLGDLERQLDESAEKKEE